MKENGKGTKKDIKDLSKKEKQEFMDQLFNKKLKNFEQIEIVEGEDYIRLPEDKIEFLNKTIVDAIRLALDENREIRINLEDNIVYIQK
jgi:hypothetical protein